MAYKPKVLTVSEGGTGNTTKAAYSLVAGGTSTTGAFQAVNPVATGQVLISGGVSALPSFSATPTVTSINFGGNALSTYTVGTWTPALKFGGASVGMTYSVQEGQYTQIGNIVVFNCYIQLTSKGSSTGVATMTGLPVSTGTHGYANNIIATTTNMALNTNYIETVISLNGSSTTITLYEIGVNQAIQQLQDTNFNNTTLISFSGVYTTA